MKRLIVKESIHGGRTEVMANKTFESASGQWIAEVEAAEIRRACFELCDGIQACCAALHIEADLDDDGKVYQLLGSV